MSYLPYKITAIKRLDATGLNILPYASVSILTSTGSFATLREADGTTPIGNPFDCDINGEREVWIMGGEYSVSVAGGASWNFKLSGASDIQSVATIAALRAFEGSADGDQVSLLGGTTPGIDGGDFYRVTNGALSDDGRDVIRYAATDIYWVRQDLAKYQIEDVATHNGLTFDQRDDTQLSQSLRRNYKYQITMPAALAPPFYTIPVNIYFKGGRYFTDFNPRALRPARTVTYYVDPVLGDDSNDGSTVDEAFRTLAHAFGLEEDADIIVLPGRYYYDDGAMGVNPVVGVNVVCEQGIAEFTNEARPRRWVESSTYPGMYETPSVMGSEDWVAESANLRFFLRGKSGSSATTAGGRRIPTASTAAIQAGTIGVQVASGNTVIRLPGNRPPTGDDFVVIYAALNMEINYNSAVVTHDFYMENISLGYGSPYSFRIANDRDDCKVILINCEFGGGHSSNNVSFACNGWIINWGGKANGGFLDGFNYHVSPTSGISFCNIFENECSGRWNGKNTSTTNNGSTIHEQLRIIRLNCDYSYNQNRNVHDIESGRSFNVGLKSRGGQQTDAPSYMIGRDGEADATQGWLIGCDIDVIRVSNAATLHISDDTVYDDLQVETGGTVNVFNP